MDFHSLFFLYFLPLIFILQTISFHSCIKDIITIFKDIKYSFLGDKRERKKKTTCARPLQCLCKLNVTLTLVFWKKMPVFKTNPFKQIFDPKFTNDKFTNDKLDNIERQTKRAETKTYLTVTCFNCFHYPDHKFASNTCIFTLQLLVRKNLILSLKWSRSNEYSICFAVVSSGFTRRMPRFVVTTAFNGEGLEYF